ncbi:MAG: zinc-binding dehydrogenase [Atribacterota bacterium]
MKALVQKTKDKQSIVLEDIQEPFPGYGEVKVKVIAAGICGTDVHGISSLKPPVVLGHEFAGVVVAIGEGVEKVKVGDRVTSETTVFHCGQCIYCREGHFNLCPHRKGIGSGVNGAFADYIVVPEATVHVLPSFLSFEEGAVLEPLACAVHAVVEQAKVAGGEKVLVLGPGPLGILVAWVARSQGAQVILAGKADDGERLKKAQAYPLDFMLDVDSMNLQEFVGSKISLYGVDVVFECSGALPAVYSGLELLRKRGRFFQLGILHKDVLLDFDEYLFSRELVLSGSRTQKKSSWEKAIAMLIEHRFPLQDLITHVLPLEDWQKGFMLTRIKEAIKVILKP